MTRRTMVIPTEPIGSIPRHQPLLDALASTVGNDPALEPLYEAAIRDTIERFEATESPVITDGEQRKYHNSPFCDDRSTSRDTAFAKIRARVLGTRLAAKILEGKS